MARKPYVHLTQLGHETALPASPEEAVMETVPNPHPGDALSRALHRARNSPSLCPITGQPDFAHLVIDYVPAKRIVESKSLKLYPRLLPQPRRLSRGLHLGIAKRLVKPS